MKDVISSGKYKGAVYMHECGRCGCVFEFEFEDVDNTTNPMFGEEWSITCPECGRENCFNAPNPIRYKLSKNE